MPSNEMNIKWFMAISLVIFVGTLTYAQTVYTPVERFDRPKTEMSKKSDLTFLIPVELGYSWSLSEEAGLAVFRNVGPTMEMIRTSGKPMTARVLSEVLMDKWENLDPRGSQVRLRLDDGRTTVAISSDVFPTKLTDGTTFVFGVMEPVDSEFYLRREEPAVLEVTVRVGPCEVGESKIKCRFVDFSGGEYRRNDWRNADLRLAQFDGADLESARFDGADLSGAIFIGADTNGASFDGSNLFGAIFE